ncbi:hypothetical protein IX324_000202 [Bacteroides pyogenes]|nr:hypothetical protein [Bacteroides pyogenes]
MKRESSSKSKTFDLKKKVELFVYLLGRVSEKGTLYFF